MTREFRSESAAGSGAVRLPSLTVTKTARPQANCPQCGQRGKTVGGQTVKALVSDSLRSVRNAQYFFCRTETCPVVYFTADGSSVFHVSEVREPVYQKQPKAPDVPICYCFQHTAAEVRLASAEGRQRILDDINAGVQAEECACDLRNPQGSCCLANVRALVKASEGAPDKA